MIYKLNKYKQFEKLEHMLVETAVAAPFLKALIPFTVFFMIDLLNTNIILSFERSSSNHNRIQQII